MLRPLAVPPPRSQLGADKRSETRNPRRRCGGGGGGGFFPPHVAHTPRAGPQREQPGPRAPACEGLSRPTALTQAAGESGRSVGVAVRGAPAPRRTGGGAQFAYLALRPTTDSESRGGGRRRKNSRGPGRPGRRSRRRAGRQERTAVESPSINFHARIIIGKLESWLPDSRFVSPNESERVGAQRRAAAGGGSSFRLYAASSKSSMLRRAIIIVSLASFPPRGRPAGEQIHADRDRGAESRDPLSPSPGRCC